MLTDMVCLKYNTSKPVYLDCERDDKWSWPVVRIVNVTIRVLN